MKMDVGKYQKFRDRLGLKEHPLAAFYSDAKPAAGLSPKEKGHVCIFALLKRARQQGETVHFDADHVGCFGGGYYMGFQDTPMPNIEYFLSCGIPGKLEGERYKKSPEMVKEYMKKHAPFVKAPGKYIVFKRWDNLEKADNPEIVIFFAIPDVLAGLYTLASFDEAEQNMVIAPFGSGCASIVQYPYMEVKSKNPRAVIGMFDISARPFVDKNELTFSAPMSKLLRMVDNMEESFLITSSWAKVQKRIK